MRDAHLLRRVLQRIDQMEERLMDAIAVLEDRIKKAEVAIDAAAAFAGTVKDIAGQLASSAEQKDNDRVLQLANDLQTHTDTLTAALAAAAPAPADPAAAGAPTT